MLVKLVLCALLCRYAIEMKCSGGGVDELLETGGGGHLCLYLARDVEAARRGGNLTALGRGCYAKLWRARRWAVARASCLDHLHISDGIRALQLADGLSCQNLHPGVEVGDALRVTSVSFHPSWTRELIRRRYDLALVAVENPFNEDDHLDNNTQHLDDFAMWIEQIYAPDYKVDEKPRGQTPTNIRYLLSSPLLVFLTTMFLPMVMFMSCFLFITFCTGTPTKMPYKNVDNMEIVYLDMKDRYILPVPTYRQVYYNNMSF